jgi:hypothetical protein
MRLRKLKESEPLSNREPGRHGFGKREPGKRWFRSQGLTAEVLQAESKYG